MHNANYMTADEAMKLIKSGDHIFVQGSAATPEVLVDALARRGHELRDVTLYMSTAAAKRVAPYCKPEYRDTFNVSAFFISGAVREYVNEGYGNANPCFLSLVPSIFRDKVCPLDVVLLNCSLPDKDGYVSFGVAGDVAVSAVEMAKTVIAQINPQMPFSYGDAVVHISKLAAAVEVDDPLLEVPTAEPTAKDIAIGNAIASYIPDGATVQIGVGGIPNAVARALMNHKHLGLHTEALTDGVLPLLKNGAIDNSLKKIMPGKSVASLALGSRDLYDFMDYNEDILFKDVAWTNDPFRVSQNPAVMAINSALEIDLTGQVCADSIGERQYSGVGGQQDFVQAATRSEGGISFTAMLSTTGKGATKIKPTLTPGAGVVTTRFQTQFVVTEHGAVNLRGKNLAERAKLLISIADPAHRDMLEEAACRRFGYSFLRMSPSLITVE